MRDSLEIVRGRGIPVVVVEGDAGEGVPRVLLDNAEAQRAAAQHVADLGHHDVVLVTLPIDTSRRRGWVADDEPVRVDVTADRLAGAREVFPHAPVLAAATSSIDEGTIAGRTIFADPSRRPTAVIAQSDLLAAGVIRAAEEAGLRVPHDVSVTGFDGAWWSTASPLTCSRRSSSPRPPRGARRGRRSRRCWRMPNPPVST